MCIARDTDVIKQMKIPGPMKLLLRWGDMNNEHRKHLSEGTKQRWGQSSREGGGAGCAAPVPVCVIFFK